MIQSLYDELEFYNLRLKFEGFFGKSLKNPQNNLNLKNQRMLPDMRAVLDPNAKIEVSITVSQTPKGPEKTLYKMSQLNRNRFLLCKFHISNLFGTAYAYTQSRKIETKGFFFINFDPFLNHFFPFLEAFLFLFPSRLQFYSFVSWKYGIEGLQHLFLLEYRCLPTVTVFQLVS